MPDDVFENHERMKPIQVLSGWNDSQPKRAELNRLKTGHDSDRLSIAARSFSINILSLRVAHSFALRTLSSSLSFLAWAI